MVKIILLLPFFVICSQPILFVTILNIFVETDLLISFFLYFITFFIFVQHLISVLSQ